MIQTVTYTELDNMLFETLRRAVVGAGYLPDIINYQSGTNAENAAAYKAAKVTLRDSIGVLTEVFGVGSFEAKGEKAINKIVIVRGNKSVGSIGGWPATQYDVTNGFPLNSGSLFKKSFLPDNSNDVIYQIKLITNDSNWDNALSAIIDNVIPQKRFLFTVDNTGNYTTKAVLILSMGDNNISAFNFIERTYKFIIKDVFLQIPQVTKVDIPVLSTIDYMLIVNSNIVDESTVVIPATTSKFDRSITVWIRTVPNPLLTIPVGRGLSIPMEYPVGTTITIDYLEDNNTVQSPIFVSGHPEQLLKCVSGVIDYSTVSEGATFVPDDCVTLTFGDYV